MLRFAERIGQTPDGRPIFFADTILKEIPAPLHVSLFAPGCFYLGHGLRAAPLNRALENNEPAAQRRAL